MPLFPATCAITRTGIELVVRRFGKVRAGAGLRPALDYLCTLTGYHCAMVVRLCGDEPVAVAYFDRDHREVLVPKAWPRAVIGACLVRDGVGRLCEVRNRRSNPLARLLARPGLTCPPDERDHVCQAAPVIDQQGELHASLCLFDLRSRGVPEADLSLLLQVAGSLAEDPHALRGSLIQLRTQTQARSPLLREAQALPGLARVPAVRTSELVGVSRSRQWSASTRTSGW